MIGVRIEWLYGMSVMVHTVGFEAFITYGDHTAHEKSFLANNRGFA